MSKKELNAALETEENGLSTTKEDFENAKKDKKWVEADKYKLKVQVTQGVIEKIKLELVKHETSIKDRYFDSTNGEKMDKIRTQLESEILDATEN